MFFIRQTHVQLKTIVRNLTIIFKVTSEALLGFYICFPVEHPYRIFFLNVFSEDTRSTQFGTSQNSRSQDKIEKI